MRKWRRRFCRSGGVDRCDPDNPPFIKIGESAGHIEGVRT